MPHQCRGRVAGIPAVARARDGVSRAVGARRARRLRRRRGLRGLGRLRPDDREADRPRRRPRARAQAHAARARRVRDRRPDDAARLPQGAALARLLRARRDVPRPRRVERARGAALPSCSRASLSQSATSGRTTVVRSRAVEVNGRRFDVRVVEPEQPWRELARRRVERGARRAVTRGSDAIVSPMQGTVLAVAVAEGDTVEDRRGALRRRGDEDGERGARAARRRRRPSSRSQPASRSRAGRSSACWSDGTA